MRLHLMSDLHLDHEPGASRRWLNDLPAAPGVEVLVLAGDCYSVATSHFVLVERLLALYPDAQILLVPGNHDYWRSSPSEVEALWKADFAEQPRVHLALEPRFVTLAGVEFFAGTLWYRRPRPGQQREFVDHDAIEGSRPWVWNQQGAFESRLRLTGSAKTVVVSHHLPTAQSTPLEFRGSPVDHFFMCSMGDAIRYVRPRLWLHGHTHTPCDYAYDSTRVVCNPRGYPHEIRRRAEYRPLEIEVQS